MQCSVIVMLMAQMGYHQPESVTQDANTGNYLVSNYNNGNSNIVVVDHSHTIIDTLVDNVSECLGIHASDGILYASCDRYLRGYDLISGAEVFQIYVSANGWLDGITSDNEGYLYVVDTGGRVFKVDPEMSEVDVIIQGLPSSTQDIEYDWINNRLIIVAWASDSSIHSYNLETEEIEEITNTDIGRYDGICMDAEGNFYAATHYGSDHVYKFDNDFAPDYETIDGDFNEPAGLYYDSINELLIVPQFGADSVSFIPHAMIDSDEIVTQDLPVNLMNIPNPFNPETWIHYSISNESVHVKLSIFNVKGQEIVTLVDKMEYPGTKRVMWNGKDKHGIEQPSGIYFSCLKTGDKVLTDKLLLLK